MATNPIVVGTLLVAALGTLYWVSKKTETPKSKKAPSFILFDDDCKETTTPKPSDAEGKKFVLAQFDAYKKKVPLGPAPGTYDTNTVWIHGFVNHLFEKLASPKCVARTVFDPNSTEPPLPPPAVAQFKLQLTLGVAAFLMERGYTVVGPMGPGVEAAGVGASLVDVVRGFA